MLKVYICSPYRGDTKANVAAARAYCRMAFDTGHDPVAPHLYYPQFADDKKPDERKRCLQLAKRLLAACNEVWVFGDISDGMRGELALARELDIPIRAFDNYLPDEGESSPAKTALKAEPKHKCGMYGNVLLTNTELDKLRSEFPADWQNRIDALSSYKKSKGVFYSSDYATVRNWARRDKEKRAQQVEARNQKSYFMNYPQRRYTEEELKHIGIRFTNEDDD